LLCNWEFVSYPVGLSLRLETPSNWSLTERPVLVLSLCMTSGQASWQSISSVLVEHFRASLIKQSVLREDEIGS